MTPQDWSRIQQGIFAGESGGDYGALYNYQNRPNGRFSGIDVTKMTVDQALDFASPSGPYGQYVKSQVGRVATPMGAYQVVGSTLRDAKRAMGLRGDEVLTPQLQDQIGQWIYKTQGTGAWEGYKGAAANNTETKPMMQEQQPRGLLGSLGIQKRDEAAGGETAMPFYQRDTFKDTAATLAQGFAAMGSMPALQKMTADIAQQRTENKARNKTAEYLKANGMEDIAELMLAGQIGAREVGAALVQRRLEKPKDDRTALMKNYEFAKQTGYEGSFNDFLRSGGAGGSVVNVGGNQVQRVGDFAVIPDEASEAGVRFVPIPGSKAAQEAQAGEQRKEAAAGQAAQKEAVVTRSIDYMLDKIEKGGLFNLPEAGVIGNLLGSTGLNQEAVDFRNELKSIQGNIAFKTLQEMREASKTGGALGSVSERELDLLVNAYGNINQSTSPDRLAKNLRVIKDIMTKIENDPVASSFYYGNSTGTGSATQPQSGSVTVGDPY